MTYLPIYLSTYLPIYQYTAFTSTQQFDERATSRYKEVMANRCKRWLVILGLFIVSLLWMQHIDQQNIDAHQGRASDRQVATVTPTLIRTAIPNPTPTATPAVFLLPLILHQTPLALANGDFEAGQQSWQEWSQQRSRLISPRAELGTIEPHSGEWAVWLGGIEGEVATITQRVSITAAQPILHYWIHISSAEVQCSGDRFTLYVNAERAVDQLFLCARNNSHWQVRTVDLSAFIGQTIALSWQIVTDANGESSSVFLDDISLIPADN